MPQSPDWKRALETGMQFTELRRSQAHRLATDLVAQGQLARDQVGAAVDELIEISRAPQRGAADGRAAPRCRRQLGVLGLATKNDLAALERRLRGAKPAAKAPAKKAADGDQKPAEEGARPRRPREEGAGEEGCRAEEQRRQEGAAKKAGSAAKPPCQASALSGAVRRRLDVELVRRGLAPSRTRAVDVIVAGRVCVSGALATTAARQVDAAEAIVVTPEAVGTRLRLARWHEARGRARRVRASTSTDGARSTSARRPVVSPTACCAAVPRTWSRSTSGAVSSRGRCATTSGSP